MQMDNRQTPRLLLVDGHNLLFQMFYGMPARITGSNGKAIQGTLGFTGALLKIIRMTGPSHVAVVFDGQQEHARRELDADYKANRPDFAEVPEEENPFTQLPDICAALDCLGIGRMETQDCEADDLIAAYASAAEREMEVVISSFDSDFFQLVTDRVSVLRYRGEKTAMLTPADIGRKFGIQPDRYADFKALVGDAADNIRGAREIGPKTAASLIGAYGPLESILDHAGSIKRMSVRESLQRDEQRLLRNKRIILLDGHAALPVPLSRLGYCDRGMTTTQVLCAIGLR